MIEVAGLTKTYGGFTAVVDSSFSIAEGEVFGIVGPNGAGKTTTLKVLAGLVEPTSGEVRVAGYGSTEPAMRHHLGFLPEESPLYEEMTAATYLRFFADLYEVPRPVANERIENALDRLDLEHRDRRLGDVSKGMRRKVAIARSLVNDPDVLVYDEPASGLDPVTSDAVLAFTRELRAAGKTVVFSAHNLHNVESVCDRVVIMNEGRIVARGTVDEIRDRHGETTYHVYTDVSPTVPRADAEDADDPRDDTDGADDAASAAADATDTTDDDPLAAAATEEVGDRYRTAVPTMAAVDRVRTAAAAAGGSVVDIRTREPSLEDVFLDVVGRQSAGQGDANRDRRRGGDAPAAGSTPGPDDSVGTEETE
ncbi:MAG: ABC-type multidrug transport system, ATPase component [uncultured archaeon A07HR67]|nr:MAG: ABC-type multidrug transport system, ATPase component [uncultured archaeon A07HR67]